MSVNQRQRSQHELLRTLVGEALRQGWSVRRRITRPVFDYPCENATSREYKSEGRTWHNGTWDEERRDSPCFSLPICELCLYILHRASTSYIWYINREPKISARNDLYKDGVTEVISVYIVLLYQSQDQMSLYLEILEYLALWYFKAANSNVRVK